MREHLTEQQINGYLEQRLSGRDLLDVDDHLAGCAECQDCVRRSPAPASVALLRGLGEPEHADYDDLAAYLAGELPAEEAARVEAHLGACPACAASLAERRAFREHMAAFPARRYLPDPPSPEGPFHRDATSPAAETDPVRRRPFRPVFQLAALAAVLAVAFFGWSQGQEANRRLEAIRRLEEANRTLQLRAEAGSSLEAEVAALHQDAAELRERNETLRREAEALRRDRVAGSLPDAGAPVALRDPAGELRLDPAAGLVRLDPLPAAVTHAVRTGAVELPALLGNLIGTEGMLRGPAAMGRFELQAPVGTVVMADRPLFTWRPAEGATHYVVTVSDAAGAKELLKSPPLTETRWRPERPLSRGQTFSWEVSALRDGDEISSVPQPPAPEARFRLLDAEKARELEAARKAHAGSHLTLGVLYAGAGLLDDAERELAALAAANPESALARGLLESVRARRSPPNVGAEGSQLPDR
jgi:anti-sigma factor RsiW